jgi:hypothetical protein
MGTLILATITSKIKYLYMVCKQMSLLLVLQDLTPPTSANSETADKLNFGETSENQRIQRKSAGTTNHIFDTSKISGFSEKQRVRRIISSTNFNFI